MPDTLMLRQEIIATCLELVRIGHFIGTWGNIAVRVDDGILLTPSRLDYEAMRPADLVAVDWGGNRIRGERLPTSEMQVHRMVLAERPDMGAVVHSHAPWISVLACTGMNLPCIVEDMAQIIGGEVRCSRYVRGGEHQELAQATIDALGAESSAVMLANHGVVVGGRNLNEAHVAAHVLEKAAMIFVHANNICGSEVIAEEAVRAERDRYLYKYGTASDFEIDSDRNE